MPPISSERKIKAPRDPPRQFVYRPAFFLFLALARAVFFLLSPLFFLFSFFLHHLFAFFLSLIPAPSLFRSGAACNRAPDPSPPPYYEPIKPQRALSARAKNLALGARFMP